MTRLTIILTTLAVALVAAPPAEPPQGFAMFGLRLQHAAIGRFGGRQIARRLGLLAA